MNKDLSVSQIISPRIRIALEAYTIYLGLKSRRDAITLTRLK